MKKCKSCGKHLRFRTGKGRKTRKYCRECKDSHRRHRKASRQVKQGYVQTNPITGRYVICMTIEKVREEVRNKKK